jgi:drug/metabolite transporter (DMT)-like permease
MLKEGGHVGLLFCLLGALAFGLMACVSKVAEQRNCAASALVVSLFGWATLVMFVRTSALGSGIRMPIKVIPVAVGFGICAAVAYFAFQTSIKIGKVTVGWLMMNLSSGVPAVVSIWVYRERLTPIKLVAFGLGLISVLCLFRGQRMDARDATKLHEERG